MKKSTSLSAKTNLSAFMCLLASLSLVGCSNNGQESSAPTSEVSSSSVSSSPVSSSASTAGEGGDTGKNAYYDPDNFIVPENKVTTTKLVTYDGPALLESSKTVSVKANDVDLFVYETRVNHGRVFSWIVSEAMTQAVIFDFEGTVHLDVTIAETSITSATLRPLAYGISPSITEHTISFDLESSGNYVLEWNDNSENALQIFANPIEENPLSKEEAEKDQNVIYVGPGIYDAGAFPIKDNTTIYLSGGSYVYGQFSAEGVKNITIRGRGIVSGSIYSRNSANEYTIPVVMRRVSGLAIEDIAFFDPAGWALHLWKCDNVKVNNVKIITARSNGDGISIQSCSDVEVSGGYVRTWDDSLVVKNSDLGSTKNINIHDVIVWTDLAQSMEVGYETYGPSMEDIKFENITVVHAMHKAVISLHNCDQAKISNVTYKNITIEDAETLGDDRGDLENDFLIDFTIAYNAEWTKSGEKRGVVDGINIENVKVYQMADSVTARMRGEDDSSAIKNVEIKGLEIEGKQIDSASALKLATNEYVTGLSFSKLDKVRGAFITLPYLSSLSDSNVAKTNVSSISQEGLIVPEFAYYKGEASFIGVKASNDGKSSATHGAGSKATTPGDDGSGDFLASGSQASYAFDGDKSTKYESGEWKGEEKEFATLTLDFASVTNVGVIRIYGDQDNKYSLTYSVQVWARKKKSNSDEMSEKYTRLVSTNSYTMSPSSGNIIDINLPTMDFGGLQLRFVRFDGIRAPHHYVVSEVEFYPPSLTYMKSIVDSTEHNDVYPVTKVVDGDPTGTSYYESKTLPATIVIDLGDVYTLQKIVLCLPPILTWSARTQEIEISVSDSNLDYKNQVPTFTAIKEKAGYLFDPQAGNRVLINIDNVKCRYLKIVIYSNDAAGGYGGQLSEVSAYGVK
jgi:hypothetical protein